jgi:S1-C subfamily serine protease
MTRLALLLATAALAGHAMAQGKPPPLGGGTPPNPGQAPPPQAAKPPALGAPGAPPAPGQAARPGSKPAALPPEGAAPGGTASAKPPPAPSGSGAPVPRQVSSGTGFVIGQGRLMTNNHVVRDCTEMRARNATGAELPARVLATDATRDLALLAVEGEAGPILRFRAGGELRRGEGVVTYGFPLAGLLSAGPTLTTGDVSALSGMRDDPRSYQISAPVQPGNSGGPLLDLGGHIVGVVVSKLNAQRIAQATGDIPQNVNFAVKGTEALAFLREQGMQPELAETHGTLLSAAEVGEIAHPSTIFLRCLR